MVEILSKYSLAQIIIFVILLAFALKSFGGFIDWAKDRIQKIAKKENRYDDLRNMITQESQERQNKLQSIEINIAGLANIVSDLTKKIDLLLESDRDDIKSFITREYNYFVLQKGEIDHYSLEAIEKRYGHYVEQGGNSFVENMMMALRRLPRKHDKIQEH